MNARSKEDDLELFLRRVEIANFYYVMHTKIGDITHFHDENRSSISDRDFQKSTPFLRTIENR